MNNPTFGWMPVTESLPDYGQEVLLATEANIYMGRRSHTDRDGEHWRGPYRVDIDRDEVFNVIYWRPLPALPESQHNDRQETLCLHPKMQCTACNETFSRQDGLQ